MAVAVVVAVAVAVNRIAASVSLGLIRFGILRVCVLVDVADVVAVGVVIMSRRK